MRQKKRNLSFVCSGLHLSQQISVFFCLCQIWPTSELDQPSSSFCLQSWSAILLTDTIVRVQQEFSIHWLDSFKAVHSKNKWKNKNIQMTNWKRILLCQLSIIYSFTVNAITILKRLPRSCIIGTRNPSSAKSLQSVKVSQHFNTVRYFF